MTWGQVANGQFDVVFSVNGQAGGERVFDDNVFEGGGALVGGGVFEGDVLAEQRLGGGGFGKLKLGLNNLHGAAEDVVVGDAEAVAGNAGLVGLAHNLDDLGFLSGKVAEVPAHFAARVH